jgi:uncharacterized membrane protein
MFIAIRFRESVTFQFSSMNTLSILLYFSAFAFLFFGVTCLFTNRMQKEFIRFGLNNNQRLVTGVLQLIGAIGLLLFKYSLLLATVSATGLSILMLLGVIVRMRIKDSIYESSPAFVFMVMNAIIAYRLFVLL